MRRQQEPGRHRHQRIVAVERMLVGGVVTVLQARQQPIYQRELIIERLGEFEERLAQTGPDTLAVAEPFEAAGELELVVAVVNAVSGEALPTEGPLPCA